jgi:serine phosphatase RsbU (regulator of sigma subunit)
MLVASRAHARPLWEPDGTRVGVGADVTYGDSTAPLAVDDVLMLYTDGYIEEPGIDVDESVHAFGEQARRALAAGSTDRLATLVDGLVRRSHTDDACLMAAEPLARDAAAQV